MSDNRVSSESTSLINDLKNSIESRKFAIIHYKQFKSGFNADSEKITINQTEYNNLLDDFEYTIIQSLQAIKSLEIENLNYREIIDELRKEYKLSNQYRNPFDEQRNNFILAEKEELSNYQINSPSFLANMNFDYNVALEKYPEMTFSNEFMEKEDAQNLRECKTTEIKSDFRHQYDINSNHMSAMKEDASYRDDEDPEYFEKKISNKYENDDINENLIYDCEPSRNLNCAEEFKLNFDYSQIKDYDKFLNAASDLKKIEYINFTNNDNKYNSYGIANKQQNKYNNSHNENIPLFNDANYDKKDKSNIDENSNLNTKEINDKEKDNYNFYCKDITIKEGLRNKIRTKSNSMKNTLISDNSNLHQTIEEEDTIQLLNSKKASFENNRFDHRDKISIFNLINKINRDERLIEFFAYEYGDGNYEKFLNRLEKEELDTKEIEKIINYITDIKQTKSSNFNSKDSSRNNFDKADDSKLIRSRSNRNFKNKQNESYDSRNSKRNNSSQREYKNDAYIEPIRLENFLRSDKPEQKRLHSNLKFSIAKSNESIKNEPIRIPRKAYCNQKNIHPHE